MNEALIFGVFCAASVYGGGPTSVSISEETAVSLLVSWLPPNAHVLQYHVSYTPLTGDARENKVSAPWECCKTFSFHSIGMMMFVVFFI